MKSFKQENNLEKSIENSCFVMYNNIVGSVSKRSQ